MRKGFTLVEMLVVIGIIAVLAAMLLPVGSIVLSRTRNWNMSTEISQLAQAVERYKNEKGDYPPSLGEIDASGNSLYAPGTRYMTVAERHLRKCYPKIDRSPGGEADFFYTVIAPRLTGDEALVFWLSLTQNDERRPFTSRSGSYKRYYDFEPDRLVDFDSDQYTGNFPDGQPGQLTLPSYKASYAGETAYVYLDSRTYAMHRQPQYALGGKVQAYFNDTITPTANQQSYMNPTTYQILCAGQDREFGDATLQFDNNNLVQSPKRFRSGLNYTDEDEDNLTNFSEGRRLVDHVP